MKKSFLTAFILILTFAVAAQEQQKRVKRETTTGQQAESGSREHEVENSGLKLTQDELQLFEKGENVRIGIKRPCSGEAVSVTWISGNKKIAAVEKNGVVIPMGAGNTIIYAQASDGSRSNTCKVTVSKPNNWGSRTGHDHLVVQNSSVYFANRADSNKLYTVNIDGKNLKRLSDDMPSHLNVTGRWIYYYNSNPQTQPGIYKISLDGNLRTLISDRVIPYYLRVDVTGRAFYQIPDGVFALATTSSDAQVQKQFDDKKLYAAAVTGEYIIYNRNWEDIEQPAGGGGVFLFDRRSKKNIDFVSVNRNTRGFIVDEQENKAYFCINQITTEKLPSILPDIFTKHNTDPRGWFSLDLTKADAQKEAMKQLAESNKSPEDQVFSKLAEKYNKIAQFPLKEEDQILQAESGWIYYLHGNELRRINTKGKLDQPVFGFTGDGNPVIAGGYIFYWGSDNRLFRTLPDGRNSLDMGLSKKL